MTVLEILLIVLALITIGTSLFLWILLRRMSSTMTEMESFFSDTYFQVSQYHDRINALFDQNVHYYDETIYEFIESSKQFRESLEQVMENYQDLQAEIAPQALPEPGPVEILGVVKPESGRGVEKL